ncbi:MAG: chromatin protein Cren7 [Acidilobaceae archaeon]
MPRRGGSPFTCPQCGARASSPIRTWTLVSPIPDKYGRVTITVMGAFICESCGKTWSSPIEKIKSGEERLEARGEGERREPEVIVIDLEELRKE